MIVRILQRVSQGVSTKHLAQAGLPRRRGLQAGLTGTPKDENGYSSGEGPQHEVPITPGKPGFYMGIREVTQAQWRAVTGTEPWSGKTWAKSGDENAAGSTPTATRCRQSCRTMLAIRRPRNTRHGHQGPL